MIIFNVSGNPENTVGYDLGILLTYASGIKSLSTMLDKIDNRIKEISHSVYPKLFLDSGVFTFAKKGFKWQSLVDDYLNYINNPNIYNKFDIMCQLDTPNYNFSKSDMKDVSGDLTFDNYVYMIDKVKTPEKFAMVFHHGENYKYLERLLQYKSPKGNRAGILGLTAQHFGSRGSRVSHIYKCVSIIRKYEKENPVKVHILGSSQADLLKLYNFYSADSSTVDRLAGFGCILTIGEGHNLGSIRITDKKQDNGSFYNISKEAQNTILAEIKKRGFNFNELQKDAMCRRRYGYSVLKSLECYMNEYYKKIYKTDNEIIKNTTLF